jgi:hypothetical protein
MRITSWTVALGVALGLAGTTLVASSRVQYKLTEGDRSSLTTILIGEGKMRAGSDDRPDAIFNPAEGSMTVFDHSRRTFTRITRDQLEQMVKMLGGAMKEMMDQAMANIPPEMRDKMKGMMAMPTMPGAGEPTTTVDTGQTATVAGRSCRVFRTMVGTRVTAEDCLAEPTAFNLPAADRATLEGAMTMMKQFLEAVSQGPLSGMARSLPFRDGKVPLRHTTIESDGARSTSELDSVTQVNAGPDAFGIPSGYTEQKLPGIGGF